MVSQRESQAEWFVRQIKVFLEHEPTGSVVPDRVGALAEHLCGNRAMVEDARVTALVAAARKALGNLRGSVALSNHDYLDTALKPFEEKA